MKVIDKIKKDPRVSEVFSEDDSPFENEDGIHWWVYLKTGWMCDPETHCIHEESLERCLRRLKEVEPCHCDECEINRR